MDKGPDGSDGFDFDSRGETEGKAPQGKGTKKSREVIKLEAVFHSGPRVRILLSVGYIMRSVELPSVRVQAARSTLSPKLPRAPRESGARPALILPLTETAQFAHCIARSLVRVFGPLDLPPVHTRRIRLIGCPPVNGRGPPSAD